MLEVLGVALNWLVAGLLFPMTLLPFAHAFGGASPVRGSIIWLATTAGICICTLVFAHFAVDLSAPAFSNVHFLYFGVLVGLTALVNVLGGPGRIIEMTAPAVTAIVTVAGKATSLFVIAMALIQFGVVILRYVFGVNSIFMQESVTYLHGAVFLLAAGYTLLADDHVRVDIFYRAASPRHKAAVDFVGTYLFLFPFCFTLLWAGGDYVANAWAVREGSTEQSGIQGIFLLKSLIPAFGLLLTLAGFVKAADAARALDMKAI